MNSWHVLICVGLIVANAVLVASGAGAIGFIPVIGCGVMMGLMVGMMTRSNGG